MPDLTLLRLTSSRLPILTNLEFTGVSLEKSFGLVIHVTADAPPGTARTGSAKARAEFWEHGSRMPQGGLVAIVTKTNTDNGRYDMKVNIATLALSEPRSSPGC